MLAHLLVLLLAVAPVPAFNRGNQLYASKDYAGAAKSYEEARACGANAAVEYNLGNAWFKQGRMGRAILSYRRARFLAPRDADVASNLAFARQYRVDKLPTIPSPLARAMDQIFHLLSLREAAILGAVAGFLAALLAAAWIVRRWTALAIAATVIALVALFGFVTQQVWNAELDEHPAVVIATEVNALSGPSEDAKEILQLHDGTEVRIREARGDFDLVQLPGGTGGWVKKSEIERIY